MRNQILTYDELRSIFLDDVVHAAIEIAERFPELIENPDHYATKILIMSNRYIQEKKPAKQE